LVNDVQLLASYVHNYAMLLLMAESMNMEMSVTAQRFKKNSKSKNQKNVALQRGIEGRPDKNLSQTGYWKSPLTDVNVVVARI
jgi:hypothetical protein